MFTIVGIGQEKFKSHLKASPTETSARRSMARRSRGEGRSDPTRVETGWCLSIRKAAEEFLIHYSRLPTIRRRLKGNFDDYIGYELNTIVAYFVISSR